MRERRFSLDGSPAYDAAPKSGNLEAERFKRSFELRILLKAISPALMLHELLLKCADIERDTPV